MQGKEVFKQLRVVIGDYYIDDIMLEVPRNYGRYTYIDSKRYDFLCDLIFLVLKTDYTNDVTKVYLLNQYMSIKGVLVEYNKTHKPLKEHGAYTSIWRDKSKFIQDFGESIIFNLLNEKDLDISKKRERLSELLGEYSKTNLLDNINLNLENSDYVYNDSLSDERFNSFLEKIRPYIKRNIERVEKSIDNETKAYINYILNHQSINEVDKYRIETLYKEING